MNDFTVSALVKDRHAGFLHEAEHDGLVAEAKRASAEQAAASAPRQHRDERATRHAWRARLKLPHLHLPGPHLPLHHA